MTTATGLSADHLAWNVPSSEEEAESLHSNAWAKLYGLRQDPASSASAEARGGTDASGPMTLRARANLPLSEASKARHTMMAPKSTRTSHGLVPSSRTPPKLLRASPQSRATTRAR